MGAGRPTGAYVDVFITTTSWIGSRRSSQLQGLLSEKEIQRTRKIMRPNDRRDYVAAHAILRLCLGRRLQCEPRSIEFATLEFGKPVLLSPADSALYSFSLSHAEGCVGAAIGAYGECGLDIEAYESIDDIEGLQTELLSAQERQFVARLPSDEHRRAIVKLWTLKESLLKARGTGLYSTPDSIELCLDGPGVRLLGAASEADRWTFDSFTYASDFHVSLCRRTDTHLRKPIDARTILESFCRSGQIRL